MGGKVSKEVRKRSREKIYDKVTFETRKDDVSKADMDAAAAMIGSSRPQFIIEAVKEKMQRIGYVAKRNDEEAGNSGL